MDAWDDHLSEGEGEVVRLQVAETLVQGGEEPDLRHVLHAQLFQQGVLVQDDLSRRRQVRARTWPSWLTLIIAREESNTCFVCLRRPSGL